MSTASNDPATGRETAGQVFETRGAGLLPPFESAEERE
jgi:hypothetical protein